MIYRPAPARLPIKRMPRWPSATDSSPQRLTSVQEFFTEPDRWLEIAVRTNGGGSYANLVPRQKITATPYAITADNLSGSISATQLNGAIPLAQLSAAVVTSNQSGVNLSGTFSGNGAGTELPPFLTLLIPSFIRIVHRDHEP